jgi:hypothetical protein
LVLSPGFLVATASHMSPLSSSPRGNRCHHYQQGICYQVPQVHRMPLQGPATVITNHSSHFKSKVFQEYCDNISIKVCYASVAHSRSNGQVERANTKIFKGLKIWSYDCLKKCGKSCVDELPIMLWSNWTTPNKGTMETILPGLRSRRSALAQRLTVSCHL